MISVNHKNHSSITVIGGGPACLKAAYDLCPFCDVTIYEKQKSIGQKFLVAGKGGFNLTNVSEHTILKSKYSPTGFLDDALDNFSSDDTIEWLNSLGIKTFVGSGKKVLAEKDHKPIDVLAKIKEYLIKNNVKIITDAKFVSFSDKGIELSISGDTQFVQADYYLFGLGGASWKVTGSDGEWTKVFDKFEIKTIPFQPSNCGININWPDQISEHHTGKPIKNVLVSSNKLEQYGEMTITEYGLEGNAVYPIIRDIRESLNNNKTAKITIDFKPDVTLEKLFEKSFNISPKNYGKSLNLTRTEMALLKSFTTKEEFLNPELFVQKIKYLELEVESLRSIDEAISTLGGISIDELNPDFSLKKLPNIYTIGEMVNWDAPTGGFLLQGCFAMGAWVAKAIKNLPQNR